MMIYVGKHMLDTYDSSVSFTKSNNLWELSTAKLERSTTIKIPCTPTNLRVLGFPNDPATVAVSDISYLTCMVDIDGNIIPGRLYTTGYDGTNISATIIFGEDIPISDMLNKTLQDILSDVASKNLHYTEAEGFTDVRAGDYALYPSLSFDRINSLLNEKLASTGFDIFSIAAPSPSVPDVDSSRLCVAWDKIEPTYYMRDNTVQYQYGVPSISPQNQSFTYMRLNAFLEGSRINTDGAKRIFTIRYPDQQGRVENYYIRLRGYKSPYAVQIVFPNIAACDKLLLAYVDTSTTATSIYTYFGGRYIDSQGHLLGGSLRGKTIVIEPNKVWTILSFDDYSYEREDDQNRIINGWHYFGAFQPIVLTIGALVKSGTILTSDMIPKMTLYDWCKLNAAIQGKLFLYDGKEYRLGGFENIASGNTIQVSEAKEKVQIAPKVGSFAQVNTISFSGGSTPGGDQEYRINNLHLSETKSLAKFQLNAGEKTYTNGIAETYQGYYVLNHGENDATLAKWTFGLRVGVSGESLLLQYPLAMLEDFPSNSKQVVISCRMPYFRFAQMRSNTSVLYGLCRYSWVSATWSDGWCKLTLQRV